MYNNIGILTPRGTGTSGHVQSNKFNLRRAPVPKFQEGQTVKPAADKKPNQGILEHNKKRQIEVKLLEMRDGLEEKGLSQEDIDNEIAKRREELLAEYEQEKEKGQADASNETHAIAQRKQEQMEKMRKAFGLGEVVWGEAFDPEVQAKKKQERIEQRQKEEKEAYEKREAARKEKAERLQRKEQERKEREERAAAAAAAGQQHRLHRSGSSREAYLDGRPPGREVYHSRNGRSRYDYLPHEQGYYGRADAVPDRYQPEDEEEFELAHERNGRHDAAGRGKDVNNRERREGEPSQKSKHRRSPSPSSSSSSGDSSSSGRTSGSSGSGTSSSSSDDSADRGRRDKDGGQHDSRKRNREAEQARNAAGGSPKRVRGERQQQQPRDTLDENAGRDGKRQPVPDDVPAGAAAVDPEDRARVSAGDRPHSLHEPSRHAAAAADGRSDRQRDAHDSRRDESGRRDERHERRDSGSYRDERHRDTDGADRYADRDRYDRGSRGRDERGGGYRSSYDSRGRYYSSRDSERFRRDEPRREDNRTGSRLADHRGDRGADRREEYSRDGSRGRDRPADAGRRDDNRRRADRDADDRGQRGVDRGPARRSRSRSYSSSSGGSSRSSGSDSGTSSSSSGRSRSSSDDSRRRR